MKNQLLTQFDLHHRLYNNVLDGFTDEETNRRLDNNSMMNHVKYLAGHLLNSQYGLASVAELSMSPKWNTLFAVMGRSEARDDIDYPDINEIKTEWNNIYKPIRHGLEKLSSEKLDEMPLPPFDQVATTKAELWAFINHHMAYHIGQIGILRSGFGKPPMSYE